MKQNTGKHNGKVATEWVNPFQPNVVFYIETIHLFAWFLYETQHYAEMG